MSSVNPQLIISNNGVDLNALNLRTDVHNTAQDRLDLVCHYGQYRQNVDQSTVNLIRTGSGVYNQFAKIQKQFEITLFYEEWNISVAVELIGRKALDDKTPIQMVDYVNPEPEDYAQGFTTRQGFINLPIARKGLFRDTVNNVSYLMDGYFAFVFKENIVRSY